MEFSDIVNDTVRELSKDIRIAKDQLVIIDVIDIYNHEYLSYDCYIATKQRMKEHVQKLNEEHIKSGVTSFKYYIDPVILHKDLFDFIYEKGKSRCLKRN